jgi:hypothetical protein
MIKMTISEVAVSSKGGHMPIVSHVRVYFHSVSLCAGSAFQIVGRRVI